MAVVAVDTNLMLLLIVGRTRRDFIPRHKRLQAHTEGDFDLIAQLVSDVDEVITTPNVMTEVSNLLVQGVREPLRRQMLGTFALLSTRMSERYHACRTTMEDAAFFALGLTDATWLCVLTADDVLVSDDRALTRVAAARGLPVFNFSDLRSQLR